MGNAFSKVSGRIPPRLPIPYLELEGGDWSFASHRGFEPYQSSGVKKLVKGTFLRTVNGETVVTPAIAAMFDDGGVSYGVEVSLLSRNAQLGVGPRLLKIAGGDSASPYILVEEDVGVSLERVLFDGWTYSGAAPGVPEGRLCELGTTERDRQNGKILFDVMTQLSNMHSAHLFHRDLRPGNICIRQIGDRPEDIRATIIDFDLAASSAEETHRGEYKSYADLLFEDLPGKHVDATPLQRDMGYFSLLEYELTTGCKATAIASASDLIQREWPLFWYLDDGTICARMFDEDVDIKAAGKKLGLCRIADDYDDPFLIAYAISRFKHGGFLDALDVMELDREYETRLPALVDSIARAIFEEYKQQVDEDPNRRNLETRDYDSQPQDYKTSCVEQALSIPSKLERIGCKVVALGECAGRQRVLGFDPSEVEYLAYVEHRRWMEERMRDGWTYGKPEDDAEKREKKISPLLVPWEELDDLDEVEFQAKEYCRQPIRNIPSLLEAVGLAVVR